VRSSTLLASYDTNFLRVDLDVWIGEDGKQMGRGQAHIPASHALTGQFLRRNGSWHGRDHHNFNEHPRSPKVGRETSPRRRVCRIDPLVPNRIVIFEQTHVSDPDLGA